MQNLRKPYQMYVLNLDSLRLFWLSFFFLVLMVLCFAFGFLVGQKNSAKKNQTQTTTENVLLRKDIPKENEDYQFYKILDRENYKTAETASESEKEDVAENPVAKKLEAPPQPKPEVKVIEQVPQNEVSGQYTIQVASYRVHKNAEQLKSRLSKENFSAYIIKVTVNDETYFRVRVGSFGSRNGALKVLDRLNKNPECEKSYITSK